MKLTNNQAASIGAAIAFMICMIASMHIPKEKEIKEVVKYKEQVRVVTKVLERPDGTKETTIVSDTSKSFEESKELKISYKSKWNVGIGSTLTDGVYMGFVQRRILGDLHIGGYARTDGEFGALISYSF